jgi:hypothetical protein
MLPTTFKEVLRLKITDYISLTISFIALLIGLYNLKQSMVRFRSETKLEEVLGDCWVVECTITNYSSRPVSVIDLFITSQGKRIIHIKPTPIRTGEFLYKLDGIAVAKSDKSTSFPLSFSPYESKLINIVLTKKPANKDSYLVIKTANRKHQQKLNVQ